MTVAGCAAPPPAPVASNWLEWRNKSLQTGPEEYREATEIALATPGVKQVITIAGISVLDNSATLSNAGLNYVIFDDWDKRAKAKRQDLVSLLTELQKKIESISDGGAFVLVPPPIQGIGNAGGFQMQVQLLGGSFNYKVK